MVGGWTDRESRSLLVISRQAGGRLLEGAALAGHVTICLWRCQVDCCRAKNGMVPPSY